MQKVIMQNPKWEVISALVKVLKEIIQYKPKIRKNELLDEIWEEFQDQPKKFNFLLDKGKSVKR